jgi:hypothetical protein
MQVSTRHSLEERADFVIPRVFVNFSAESNDDAATSILIDGCYDPTR